MRALIKLYGYTMIGLLMMLCTLQFVSTNIRRDEMETAATMAMSQTQTAMAEQIEDRKYGTHTARVTWVDEDEYFQYFADSFQIQLTTNSACRLDRLDCDLEKGLLRVRVTCSYNKLNGEVGSMTVTKTGIVEQQE